VLQDGFGRVPVIDFGKHPTPGANQRFQDHRVSKFLDGSQGRLGVKATLTRGWGTDARTRAAEVASLSPQVAATCDIFTDGTPRN